MQIYYVLCLTLLPYAAITYAAEQPILNENGQAGIIRYPSARNLPAGTITTGLISGTPYHQLYAGWQAIPALNITIRQAQDSHTDLTYPGIDAKLQLWQEEDWLPQAALGYQHAFGQARLAGEYLVFSKRVWDVDCTMGAGWGRLGRDRAVLNFTGQTDPERDNGFGSTGPANWFRGRKIGLFGGFNYQIAQTPFTLQAEYDPDDWYNERRDGDPVAGRIPANIGLHYQWQNVGLGISWQQGDRIGASVSYAMQPASAAVVRPAPEIEPLATQTTPEQATLVFRNPDAQIPAAGLGQAAAALSKQVPPQTRELALIPEQSGLTANEWHLLNRQMQQAEVKDVSAAEIWHSTTTATALKPPTPWLAPAEPFRWQARWQQDISVYEFGTFMVGREKLLLGGQYEPAAGLIFNLQGRLDQAQNTDRVIKDDRPVRSWLNDYVQRGYGAERAYVAILDSITPALHVRGIAGELEEMFGGAGGELLYQPLEARWAVGLEAYHLYPRAAEDIWQLGGKPHDTGFASFYYETPAYHLTSIVRVGQFLARDQGVVTELQHHFDNGVRVGLRGTWSNRNDFSGPTDYDHYDLGLALSVPLGRVSTAVPDRLYGVPLDVNAGINLHSLGRDKGQMADIPLPLFNVSRPVRYGPITSSWQTFLTQLP